MKITEKRNDIKDTERVDRQNRQKEQMIDWNTATPQKHMINQTRGELTKSHNKNMYYYYYYIGSSSMLKFWPDIIDFKLRSFVSESSHHHEKCFFYLAVLSESRKYVCVLGTHHLDEFDMVRFRVSYSDHRNISFSDLCFCFPELALKFVLGCFLTRNIKPCVACYFFLFLSSKGSLDG